MFLGPRKTRLRRLFRDRLEGETRRKTVRQRAGEVAPRVVVLAIFAGICAAILTIGEEPLPVRLGERAAFDILSRVPFSFQDTDATRNAREQARLRTPNVYALDRERMKALFAEFKQRLQALAAAEDPAAQAQESFAPAELTETDIAALRTAFGAERADSTEWFLDVVLLPEIENLVFLPHARYEIEQTRRRIRIRRDGTSVYDVPISLVYSEKETERILLKLPTGDLWKSFRDWKITTPIYRAMVKALAPAWRDVCSWDELATQEAALAAAATVRPVIITRDEKDVLLTAGEVLREHHVKLLSAEQEEYRKTRGTARWRRGLGIVLFIYAAVTISYVLVRRSLPGGRPAPRHVWALVAVVLILILGRIAVNQQWSPYIIPVGLAGIILAAACGTAVALCSGTLASVLVGILFGNGFAVMATFLAGSATAVIGAHRIATRVRLMIVGLVVGIAQFLTICSFALISNSSPRMEAAYGLANGLAVGLLATGLLPFLEHFMGMATSISLLELSDLNRPLLKKLALVAPGTYNHSLIVGHLAEAAAKAVGADTLLVRVASFYHDIGKMNKPDYCVENRGRTESKHLKLTPTMSTLVIIAHTKDGLELADQYRLPPSVRDMITQHHGTTLVQYFYAQAQNAQPHEDLDEQAFRYPGPKPQTAEAAIIMLADAVESASRAMREPTPARIDEMVRRIVRARLEDGQFEECNLSLRVLHRIADELSRTLASMFHARVAYPSLR